MTELAARAFDSKILESRLECRSAKTLRLETPPNFAFLPGMWVMVHVPGKPTPARAYSIASSPHEKGSIEISFNAVGDFTRRLFELKEGQALAVQGPYGKWLFQDSAERAVMISGGTGITPFRSMCRYALEKRLPVELSLFYSSKTPADILYREELSRFSRNGIQVYLTITRPQDLEPGQEWKGPVGRLDVELLQKEVPHFREALYYLCGPVSMVNAFTEGLIRKGIPRERIRYEKWGDY